MKKVKELTYEQSAALYSLVCRASGAPTFEPKTVEVDSLGGFAQAVIDAHKELENQGGNQND